MDMSLLLDTTANSTADVDSDTDTNSEQPASADNWEQASANNREPASADGKHSWSPATGELTLSERRDRESVDATYSSIFRGDSDAETDSRLRDQSFDEKGVEPVEEDAKSKEPVRRLPSSDSPFEARSAEEVLPSGNSENGQEGASMVETKNGSESLEKVEDSGYYNFINNNKNNLLDCHVEDPCEVFKTLYK